MPDFETVGCVFGHTTPPIKLFDRPDYWFELPGEFCWYRCPECDLFFLSPRPTLAKIADYYLGSYAAYSPAIDDEKFAFMRWKRRRNMRHSITAVAQREQPGHLLDVGCATGNYLVEMKKLGWQVSGVELQADAASYARHRFNLDVFTGDLLESQFPDQSFNAVTLWDVLEHTHDPVAILKEARRILKPRGLLVFSIPDPHCSWARRFRASWIGYDSPRHLNLFHDGNLQILLNETGFSYEGSEYFLATYHTWVASFHTWLNTKISNGSMRKFLLNLAYLPIWSPLTAPYFYWLNRNGRGDDLTVYARA